MDGPASHETLFCSSRTYELSRAGSLELSDAQLRNQRFIVLPRTMGRCGSTWYCELLNSHSRVSCLGEVFNWTLRDHFKSIRASLARKADPDVLFSEIAKFSPESEWFGFKIFRGQIEDTHLDQLIRGLDLILMIDRRNLTAALASDLHAKISGKFHVRDVQHLASVKSGKITIDIDHARKKLRVLKAAADQLSAFVRTVGIRTVETHYEDLLADTQGVMDGVFLELDLVPEEVRSSVIKIHHDMSFVANLSDVNRELGPEFGRLDQGHGP